MPDVFITLEEAAAFEGITYEAMKKRVQRSPKQHNVKSQAREGGGKDQVLISTSSLSAKARKAWRAAQKVEGSEVIIDKRAQEAVPWYVTADLNQYTEANKKRFYEAVELAARVQDFIDYDGPDRTGYAERYALGLGISPQSLYRYMKNVLEANAWALKLEKEDGKSRDYFRALALCRKPKETGTFPSLTDEQKAIIENIWFDKRFAANLGTIEMLYERFELEAERREWEEYPSIKTVARYIKFLMGQRGAESARFLAANGTREWKNKRMMKGKRDATSLQVMEYVVGDEHTFDFWVQWTAPNGKIKAVRPKLVAWLDMRSRAIIGDVACVNANSQTLKESLVKMIYSNPGGVPHILHVDNGKDYTAKAMTGQNRKHRKIDLDFAFDSETVGFYERLARYCDEQISKAILGQTLTSDSGGGGYAQSKTHNDVRHDLTVADCKALASTLRRDLIRPLCIFNFGEDKRIPYIRFDCEESEDLTQTATILGTLIEKVGLRIPTSFVYKKFSIPEPEEGDEIAKPTYGGGMGGVLPFKSDALLSLKAGADAPIGTQQHIDRLAAAALHKGVGSFKRAFEPVLKMIENADSLEQLRELMEDDTAVAELYAAMDVSEVEELLQKVMLYADLEGRVVEDG